MTALYDEVLTFCRDALERQGHMLLDAIIEPGERAAVRKKINWATLQRDLQKHFRARCAVMPLRRSYVRRWVASPYPDRLRVSPEVMQSIGQGRATGIAGYVVVVFR
jgi:hypothetical protein